jgi:hypothetical protein
MRVYHRRLLRWKAKQALKKSNVKLERHRFQSWQKHWVRKMIGTTMKYRIDYKAIWRKFVTLPGTELKTFRDFTLLAVDDEAR